MQVLGQIRRGSIHTGVIDRLLFCQIGGKCFLIVVGNVRTLFRICDHNEVIQPEIAAIRRLDGDVNTLLNDLG